MASITTARIQLPALELSEPAGSESVRWSRVALVAIGFFLVFYAFEHDARTFAGGAAAGAKEERVKDEYIDRIESGSATRKLVVLAFAGAGVIAASQTVSREWNVRRGAALLFALVLLWVAASFLFSYQPSLTLRRMIASGILMAGALGYARTLRINELLAVALVSAAGFVGYSLLLDLAAGGRPWQGDYRFAGTLHPNTQAAYCGMLCLAAFCFPAGFGRRWAPRLLFLFGFVMLLQTQSRGGLLALLVALVLVFLMRLSSSTRWLASIGCLCVAAGAMVLLGTLSNGDKAQLTDAILLGRTEQASSLTGRVPLWEQLSGFVAKRPLTGYGYESFWTADRIDEVMKQQNWAIQSSHNSYLEITLQLGLIGLALVLALVAATMGLLQTAYNRTQLAGYAFAYGLFAFGLVNSLFESNFAKLKYPTIIAWIAMLSVVFFFPRNPDDPDRKAKRFRTGRSLARFRSADDRLSAPALPAPNRRSA